MKKRPDGNWIIFRDCPKWLGISDADFLRAMDVYGVNEYLIPGTETFGVKVKHLEWLKERLAESGLPGKRTRSEDGMVYVAKPKHGRTFKVGFSVDPRRRIGELQTGQHGKLAIIHSEPGTRALEKKVHRVLDPYRLGGEWFMLNDQTKAFLETIQQTGIAAFLGR